MARLTPKDVRNIPKNLEHLDAELNLKIGASLTETSKRAAGFTGDLLKAFQGYKSTAVPMTAGKGIIKGFTEAMVSITEYLGLKTKIIVSSDVKGLVEAITDGANIIFAADDDFCAGFNLKLLRISHNSEATGRAYAAALELRAGGINGERVSVIGIGRVGRAAVEYLQDKGAMIYAFDIDKRKLREPFFSFSERVHACSSLRECLSKSRLILLSGPKRGFIKSNLIDREMVFSVPSIPLGFDRDALKKIPSENIIHDFLELGVATMAVELVV